MSKSPAPPPPPDYAALAQQQAGLNKEAIDAQTLANRVNQNTPEGSVKWTKNPDGTWTQDVTYSPDQQQLYENQNQIQQGLSQAGLGMLGGVTDAVSQPFSLDGAPAIIDPDRSTLGGYGQFDLNGLTEIGDPGFGAVEQVRDAMMSRLRPDLDRGRAAEIQRLKSQGITEGSPAWQQAMQSLNRSDVDASQQALLAGAQEYGNIFNRTMAKRGQEVDERNLAANYANALRSQQIGERLQERGLSIDDRQRYIQEMLMRRTQPLNELTAFMSGSQVQQPTFSNYAQAGNAGAPDMMGAAQAQYKDAMDAYAAKQKSRSGMLGGLMGLAGSAAGSVFGPLGTAAGGALAKGVGSQTGWW